MSKANQKAQEKAKESEKPVVMIQYIEPQGEEAKVSWSGMSSNYELACFQFDQINLLIKRRYYLMLMEKQQQAMDEHIRKNKEAKEQIAKIESSDVTKQDEPVAPEPPATNMGPDEMA